MPFADNPLWEDSLSYSGLVIRRQDAMMVQADGTAGGAVGGIRPGDIGLAVSLAGSTITVTAGVAALYKAGFGVYRVSNPSSWTGTLTAANATNPRIDLVYVRVWDNAEDSSGLVKADVVYLAGTAAPAPVAPAPGALEIYIPLATINVPASGGGSPSVSSTVRAITVAPGGISPSGSQAGTYAGQYRDGGTLQRYNGTVWEDRLYLASGGQVNIGGSASTANIAVQTAASGNTVQTYRVAGDTQNRLSVDGAGKHQWGPGGSTTQDTNLYRSGAGQLTTDGSLAAGAMAPTVVEDVTAGRTTTSLTYVSVNSMTGTVVVPASGRVRVLLRVAARNSTTNNSLSNVNVSGSTSGTIYTGVDAAALIVAGTNDVSLTLERIVTGTPGETLTVTPVHRVNSASTMTIDYRYLLLEPIL
jgi:hypothetical protein